MVVNPLKRLPSVPELLQHPALKGLTHRMNRNVLVSRVRTFVDRMRVEAQHKASQVKLPDVGELAERVTAWILSIEQPPLRPVINGTGVLMPEQLGRSPLSEAALQAIAAVGQGYAGIEVDATSGQTRPPHAAVARRLAELAGAEQAIVAGGFPSAVLLAFTALAGGRRTIVSRGQMLSLGDCRLPEVLAASGAELHEVGTANRTTIDDFAAALDGPGAVLVFVATVSGAAEQATLAELVELARKRDAVVVVVADPATLIPLDSAGLADVPCVTSLIRRSAELAVFRGDGLVGGPPCGVIVGRRRRMDVVASHPLCTTLSADRLALAALAATAELYRDEATAVERIPLLAAIHRSVENLRNRAERLAAQLSDTPLIASAEPVEHVACLTEPQRSSHPLPSWAVALTPGEGSSESLQTALRSANPAIFGRTEPQRLLLDLRSILPAEDPTLVETIGRFGADGTQGAAPSEPNANSD